MKVENDSLMLSVTMLQMIFYVAIPLVVDLVTRRFTNEKIKAGVVAVLALLAATVQEVIEAGEGITLAGLVAKFVTALVTTYVTHKYLLKPAGVTGDTGAIQRSLPKGIGKVDPAKLIAGRVEERRAA